MILRKHRTINFWSNGNREQGCHTRKDPKLDIQRLSSWLIHCDSSSMFSASWVKFIVAIRWKESHYAGWKIKYEWELNFQFIYILVHGNISYYVVMNMIVSHIMPTKTFMPCFEC